MMKSRRSQQQQKQVAVLPDLIYWFEVLVVLVHLSVDSIIAVSLGKTLIILDFIIYLCFLINLKLEWKY